jgi:ring-1,2-phenylacetyl-CoA epoxidase subunit PaaC
VSASSIDRAAPAPGDPTTFSRSDSVATRSDREKVVRFRIETSSTGVDVSDIAEYALRLGDDALVLSQRMGEWVSNAPELEEDVALANIGLDLLGQARALLTYAGSHLDKSEDELAYFRGDTEFRCAHLMCTPRGDFAVTIARMLIVAAYQRELYARLADSADETLSGIARKAVKEVAYHFDHARMWTLRLGDGTDESHGRIQQALTDLWPMVDELLRTDELEQRLVDARIAVDASTLRDPFDAAVDPVVAEATLARPEVPAAAGGGRFGRPSEHLGHLLAEMQVLAREHPGATW